MKTTSGWRYFPPETDREGGKGRPEFGLRECERLEDSNRNDDQLMRVVGMGNTSMDPSANSTPVCGEEK
jgi:hypothetical protein